MVFFSIVMIPMVVIFCMGIIFYIAMQDSTTSHHEQEGSQPDGHVESTYPVELIRLH